MSPRHQAIEEFAKQKMAEFGLIEKGWEFGWNNRRRSLGLCLFQRRSHFSFSTMHKPLKKRVVISRFMTNMLGEEEQRDTVLHEIAHALDFEQRGKSDHDEVWKWWAVKVGAKPIACHRPSNEVSEAIASVSKYTLVCPNGHKRAMHKKPKVRRSCSTCCPGYFNEDYVFELIQNY